MKIHGRPSTSPWWRTCEKYICYHVVRNSKKKLRCKMLGNRGLFFCCISIHMMCYTWEKPCFLSGVPRKLAKVNCRHTDAAKETTTTKISRKGWPHPKTSFTDSAGCAQWRFKFR
jgi:hypothetical protein